MNEAGSSRAAEQSPTSYISPRIVDGMKRSATTIKAEVEDVVTNGGIDIGAMVSKQIRAVLEEMIEGMYSRVEVLKEEEIRAISLSKFLQELRALGNKVDGVLNKFIHNSSLRSLPHFANSPGTPMQLDFVGSLQDTFYTRTCIGDHEDVSLKVVLRDISGSIVKLGHVAYSMIKMFVLDGDFNVEEGEHWTSQEFDKHIVKPRLGKGPLLKGKCEFFMRDGVASVTDIAFTDNSRFTRSARFRFGVRVVNGAHPGIVIREAVSEAFKVKERRLTSYRERTLSLEDSVQRLKYIGSSSSKKLAHAQIHTVKDFLQLYHTDAIALRQVLCLPEKKWLEMAKEAESCLLTNEVSPTCRQPGSDSLSSGTLQPNMQQSADTTPQPLVNSATNKILGGHGLCRINSNRRDQETCVVGKEQLNSTVQTAELEELFLTVKPDSIVDQTQDSYPQHQNLNTLLNASHSDSTEAILDDQLRFDSTCNTEGVIHAPQGPMGLISKRPRRA